MTTARGTFEVKRPPSAMEDLGAGAKPGRMTEDGNRFDPLKYAFA